MGNLRPSPLELLLELELLVELELPELIEPLELLLLPEPELESPELLPELLLELLDPFEPPPELLLLAPLPGSARLKAVSSDPPPPPSPQASNKPTRTPHSNNRALIKKRILVARSFMHSGPLIHQTDTRR